MVCFVKRGKLEQVLDDQDHDERAWNGRRAFSSIYLDDIEVLTRDGFSHKPTPEEIAIARIDGICPRCDRPIDVDDGSARCACGFSF